MYVRYFLIATDMDDRIKNNPHFNQDRDSKCVWKY